MKFYLKEAKELVQGFEDFQIEAIPRESNQGADALSKYDWVTPPPQVHFIENVHEKVGQDCASIDKAGDWVTHISTYLESGELPEDEVNAKRITRLTPNYRIINGMLYKKGFSMPFFRCGAKPETITILREVHER